MRDNILPTHVADKAIDLNDLRIFAYVASLASFSSAADALQMHKSSVSRSIARLELLLQTPLLQRTTRKVRLTPRGMVLQEGCLDMLSRVSKSVAFAAGADSRLRAWTAAGSLAERPKPKASPGKPAVPRRSQGRLGAPG
jgi:DNA-binding transcriptional LysR family regulator